MNYRNSDNGHLKVNIITESKKATSTLELENEIQILSTTEGQECVSVIPNSKSESSISKLNHRQHWDEHENRCPNNLSPLASIENKQSFTSPPSNKTSRTSNRIATKSYSTGTKRPSAVSSTTIKPINTMTMNNSASPLDIMSGFSPSSWRLRAPSNNSTDYSADTHLQGLNFLPPPPSVSDQERRARTNSHASRSSTTTIVHTHTTSEDPTLNGCATPTQQSQTKKPIFSSPISSPFIPKDLDKSYTSDEYYYTKTTTPESKKTVMPDLTPSSFTTPTRQNTSTNRSLEDNRGESSTEGKMMRQQQNLWSDQQYRIHTTPSTVYETHEEQQLESAFLHAFPNDGDVDGFHPTDDVPNGDDNVHHDGGHEEGEKQKRRVSCGDSCISSLSADEEMYSVCFDPPVYTPQEEEDEDEAEHVADGPRTPMREQKPIDEGQGDIGIHFEHLVVSDNKRRRRQRQQEKLEQQRQERQQQDGTIVSDEWNRDFSQQPNRTSSKNNNTRGNPCQRKAYPHYNIHRSTKSSNSFQNIQKPALLQSRSNSTSAVSLTSTSQSSSQHGRVHPLLLNSGKSYGGTPNSNNRPRSSNSHKSNNSNISNLSNFDVFSYSSVPESSIVVNGRVVTGIKKRHGHKDSISFMVDDLGSNASNSFHQRSQTSTSIYEAALNGEVEQMEMIMSSQDSNSKSTNVDGSFEDEYTLESQSQCSRTTTSRVKKVKEEVKYVMGKMVPAPLRYAKDALMKKKKYELERSHGCLT